jgi:hypothetical protein
VQAKEFDMISIYKSVLNGKLKRFPPETWNPYKSGYDNAHRSLRYLVFELLKWDRQTFCENMNLQIIRKYKLNGAFSGVYKRNIYPYISASFPEWELKPWEIKKSRVPANYWNEETTREAIRWLVEKRLKWDKETVINELSATVFKNHNLEGMLQSEFQHSPYQAICHAYPDENWSLMDEKKGYKLTPSQTEELREMYRSNQYTQVQIAKHFNLSPSNVSLIVNDKLRAEKKPIN